MIEQVFEYNQHFVAMMNVINAARLNPPESGDKHHIIPRCWFTMNNLPIDNSDENLVLLTKEQHGKVHKLMSLCAKDEQLKRNMVIAAHLMGLPTTSLKYTHTKEARQKISDAGKGRIFSDDTRKKISERQIGKKLSDEHRKKLSESHKGRKMSAEHKAKISASMKKYTFTDEHKKKISEARKGCIISEEQRRKISSTLKNRNMETK